MTSRVTRRAAAKEAAFLNSDKENATPQFSSPPATPAVAKPTRKLKTIGKAPALESNVKSEGESLLTTPSTIRGKLAAAKDEPLTTNFENEGDSTAQASSAKKRKRHVKHEDTDGLIEAPHNLGGPVKSESEGSESEGYSPKRISAKKSATKKKTTASGASDHSAAKTVKDEKDAERAAVQLAQVKARFAQDAERRENAIASGKKTKSETYGLSEGQTPFPRCQRPTPGECQEVHDILLKHHPDTHPQPKTVPPPSQFVAGCGEVRSILDALIRTRLSASTTGRNSNAAYQGMVQRYGLLKSGVGKGSVNYNAVRKAPVQELFYAIKGGGLAVSKSADIKALLDFVYDENQARHKELLAAKDEKDTSKAPKGADVENERQKAAEIKLAEDENLSLDHFYTLPTYDAIYKFMTFPGIGVKTAACVAMFSMQRPVFAVDTHVFRLSKWLGWVPSAEEKQKGDKTVDRDTTFSHLEVMIPDGLKYMLHQLFIKHGKTCPRCRGNTGEGTQGWAKGCPIDDLVQRSGPRKGNVDSPSNAKSSTKRRKMAQESDEDEEDEEMPDLNDDEEDSDESTSPSKKRVQAPVRVSALTPPKPFKSSRTKATADVPLPGKATAKTRSKRKSTPLNGWRGGKAVSSREASTE